MPHHIYRAWVWATGEIEINGGSTPDGALQVATFLGLRAALVGASIITTTARHAYDGQTLLVPGVPEADDQDAGMSALLAWLAWIAPTFARRIPASRFTLAEPA